MPIVNTRGTAGAKAFGYTNGFPLPISYLIVGGGGGTYGQLASGGAGSGQIVENVFKASFGRVFTITVGGGGTFGGSGNPSGIVNVISAGGGDGTTGGSGATSGNGYPGGAPFIGAYGEVQTGGGGGGSGEAGQNGVESQGGNGGNGTSSSISGASVTRGGGGGGGSQFGGNGGSGGGGSGNGGNGTANTGGGAAGSYGGVNGQGGSGIVILRYRATSQKMTGGTVTSFTTAGVLYYVHTFESSGTLSWL
jgi:hypothetical protein